MENAQVLKSQSETRADDTRLEWTTPMIQSLKRSDVETGGMNANETVLPSVFSVS